MDNLIDLVLSNPLFLVILIGGIISLMKGKSEQENKGKETTTQKPKQNPLEELFERSKQREQTRTAEKVITEPKSTKSIDELREKQMSKFTQQVDDEIDQEKVEQIKNLQKHMKEEHTKKNRTKKAFRKDFTKSLSSKGLVNSVIMAEVLGPPRGRRSYQNIISKRRTR